MAFSVGITALAGFIDSIGFLSLGGYFLSFMSGNTTKFGVSVGQGQATSGLICVAIILLFLVGVIVGALIGRRFESHSRSAVLLFVTLTLALSCLGVGMSNMNEWLGLTILGMGAINTAFDREVEGSFGFTFVSGALVRAGQRIAWAMLGDDRKAWMPYLLLWLGLTAGAVLGGVLASWTVAARLGLASIWCLIGLVGSHYVARGKVLD